MRKILFDSGTVAPTRRDLFTGALAALTLGASAPSLIALPSAIDSAKACSLSAEKEEGPYYVDRSIMRSNITEAKPGLPLKLRITVIDSRSCKPVSNAALDIWHCDASGIYSGYTHDVLGPPPGGGMRPPPGGFGPPPDGGGPGFPGGPGGGPGGRGFHHGPSDSTIFLRGVQFTDRAGVAEFTTIYPGWYVSRDTHIHMKVRIGGAVMGDTYKGGHVSHTGQLFFPDAISDQIMKLPPYNSHQGHRTLLEEDHVFTEGGGPGLIVTLDPFNAGSYEKGFTASAVLAVDPEATPKPTGFGPPRGARPTF